MPFQYHNHHHSPQVGGHGLFQPQQPQQQPQYHRPQGHFQALQAQASQQPLQAPGYPHPLLGTSGHRPSPYYYDELTTSWQHQPSQGQHGFQGRKWPFFL